MEEAEEVEEEVGTGARGCNMPAPLHRSPNRRARVRPRRPTHNFSVHPHVTWTADINFGILCKCMLT